MTTQSGVATYVWFDDRAHSSLWDEVTANPGEGVRALTNPRALHEFCGLDPTAEPGHVGERFGQTAKHLFGSLQPVLDKFAGSGLYRLDVVCWAQRPGPNESLGQLVEALSAQLNDTVVDSDLPDPWSPTGDPTWRAWPQAWRTLPGDSGVFAYTDGTLGAVRLWVLITDYPYDEPGNPASISNLLETDESTGTSGALASYIDDLGVGRGHLTASRACAETAKAIEQGVRTSNRTASDREILDFGEAVSGMSEAAANIETTATNLPASRATLVARLNDTLAARTADIAAWNEAESRGDSARSATIRANLGRYQARLTTLAERTRHADAKAAQHETKANTRATLLLAIIAGALAAGAIPNDVALRVAASIATGGVLFAVAVLIAAGSHHLSSTQRAAIWIGFALTGAASGWALCPNLSRVIFGGLTGITIAASATALKTLWDSQHPATDQ